MGAVDRNHVSYIYEHSTKGLDVPINNELNYLFRNNYLFKDVAPDICVITVTDETSNIYKSSEFTIARDSEKITYRLDSIIIRNTEKNIFVVFLLVMEKKKHLMSKYW